MKANKMHLIENELNVFGKRLNHSNIIQVHEMMEDDSNIYQVLEYAKYGSLIDYIMKKNCLGHANFLKELDVREIMR